MTLKRIWQEFSVKFHDAGIPEPEMDAWYLLEYVTGITRAKYFMNPDQKLTDEQLETYSELANKRMQRIPLQHLTGVQEFMGYEFLVSEAVLIPRQDTEILVEEAAGFLKNDMHILDVCTGSGCILLSLLKIAQEKHLRQVNGTGTDISEGALEIARKNAKRLLGEEALAGGSVFMETVSAKFIQGDLLEPVSGRTFDMIVSNPPYIPTEEIEKLEAEVKIHDPMIALDGGEDGLIFYRKIIREALHLLKPGGRLLFEIGYDQGEAVSSLMENAGFSEVVVKKDFAGLDRVVFGVYDR